MIKKTLPTLQIILLSFCGVFTSANGAASNFDYFSEFSEYTALTGGQHTFKSKYIDQEYKLYLQYPEGYFEDDSKRYPVIYVLDGQWNFGSISSVHGALKSDKQAPDVLIVAITWEGDYGSLRMRDFTPELSPRSGNSGGAETFLKVLEKEIIPFIDSKHRTTPKRVLTGVSLGGLFSTYVLFERPMLFDTVISIAPSYPFAPKYFASKFEEFSKKNPSYNTNYYIACGTLDFCKPDVQQFSEKLRALNIPGINMRVDILEGVGHSGIVPSGYTFGLQMAFARKLYDIKPETLESYVGVYSSPDWSDAEISVVGNTLLLKALGTPYEFIISPESETKFFANGKDMRFEFGRNSDNVMQLTGHANGGTFVATKR